MNIIYKINMTLANALCFFCILSSPQVISAQSSLPYVEWQKCLGGNNGDYAWSIDLTSDGGYIAAGYTEGVDNGDIMGYHGNIALNDLWVVKLDNTGNIQWQKCLGGNSMETGGFIRQTSDGGYIVAGSSASVDCNITGNHRGLDYWVVKLNNKGEIVWQKMYGGSQNDYGLAMALAADGSCFVSGFTESNDGDVSGNHGSRDYWVIKIDASGNLKWQKTLGGSGDDESNAVVATVDGGCVVGGLTQSNDGDVTGNHGNTDAWIVKLDVNGNIQWQKAVGGSSSDQAWSIQNTSDGGYIFAGFTVSNDGDVSGNHGSSDFWVVKMNNSGTVNWQKCYGGGGGEVSYNIYPTKDGGYLVTGSAQSNNGDLACNSGYTDVWVIKIDNAGNLIWQKDLGGNLYDEGHCVKETTDGGAVVAGSTCSSNISGYHTPSNLGTCDDFWIIKLTPPLNTPPAASIKINPAGNICAGASTTLQANVLYAGVNPVYQWARNGVNVGGNNSTYTASDFVNNENVSCTITNGSTPCENIFWQASDNITINTTTNAINPIITISSDNTIICNCTTVTFNASVSNAGTSPIYQWLLNGLNTGTNGAQYVNSALKSGDVIVCRYYDASSCVVNGYATSNAVQMSAGTSAPPSVKIAASIDTICSGSTVLFNASPVNAGINPVYQWQVNGINTGSNSNTFSSNSLANSDIVSCLMTIDPAYACATVNNAQSNKITITVASKADPSVTIQTDADTICAGMTANFIATAAHAGSNPSYQWQINGLDVGVNSKDYSTAALSSGDVVTCVITVDPLYTCALSNSATSAAKTIFVKNITAPSVSITPSANEICQGDTIIFNAIVQDAGVSPAYEWFINSITQNDHSNIFSSSILSDGDKIFCEVVPGTGACSSSTVSSNIVSPVIDPLPVISVSPADTVINYGNTIDLHASVSPDVISYEWNPANDLSTPGLLLTTTKQLTENTLFSFTATSDKGCKSVATAAVKIYKILYMPSAFSPNGDGVNDIFKIPADVTLDLKEFSVYNRWGNRIFTTNNVSKGWDGTFNGKMQDAGVYVFFISGSNAKGKIFIKGTVTLIR
ncbi:MAG TPA: gliding motility-associated C-terminal domain-containing protein [Puia sp.]|nr:gliding motility-associated C-terminal domain-containing protein [Puia sp.]